MGGMALVQPFRRRMQCRCTTAERQLVLRQLSRTPDLPLSASTAQQPSSFGPHLLQQLRQHAHVLQVDVKQLLQARPLHLDHHLLALDLRVEE